MKTRLQDQLAESPTSVAAVLRSNRNVIEHAFLESVHEAKEGVRKITERAIATTCAILKQYGQLAPILVTVEGEVICGEEVILAAKRLGWKHVDVLKVNDISDADRRILSIALARIPELSGWNDGVLKSEITSLVSLDVGLEVPDLIGFNMAEIDVRLDPVGTKSNEPDPMDTLPPMPLAHEISVRRGDVFLLGKHRILCGDALDQISYATLLGLAQPRVVVTDSPYNLRIPGVVSGLGKNKHTDFAMGVGEMSFEEFKAFLRAFLLLCCAHLVEGGLIYAFMDRRKLSELLQAASEAGLKVFDLAFWNKLSGGMGSFYRSAHEPCLVFKYGDAPHINNIELGKHGRYRTNVWDFRGLSSFGKGRDEALKDHPTVKPVALLAEIIKDCSKRGEAVLDPFAGSGSTIIAAEKTGRVGLGIEIEPKYVEVILRRWETLTGKQAVLEETGETFAEVKPRRAEKPAAAPAPAKPPAVVRLRQRPVSASKDAHHG